MASRIYPCRWIVSHVSVQVESLGPGSIRLHRVRRGKPAEHGVQVSRPQVRKARFTIELLPGVAIRTRGAAASPYRSEGVVVCAARQCARALVESLCYARSRRSWKKTLIDHPLMRRKLAEMIVDVEGVQAMVFDGYGHPNRQRQESGQTRLRMAPALIKLKAARLGITTASDAIEVHGGNGYVETWPVARILRDAQINTLWEGPDNILCLDVRRAIKREGADAPFIDRLREAIDNAGEAVPAARLVSQSIDDLATAITAWKALDGDIAEARLYPLAQFMAEVYAAALLCEQAEWELREYGDDRKSLVAALYAERYLKDRGPLRGMTRRRASRSSTSSGWPQAPWWTAGRAKRLQ